MNLTAATHTLELVTSSATAVTWTVSGSIIDKSGATAFTPLSGAGSVAAATDTTIASAPAGASIYHVITGITVYNAGALAITVTVQKDVSGTEYPIITSTLLAGESLVYEDASGWDSYTATGERKTSGRDGADGAAGAAGAPGVGTTGTATIDFGGWPGSDEASVAVTGQAGIVSGSVVEASIQIADSADHSADEHRIEQISVTAGDIVAATGFTIYANATNNERQPVPSTYPHPKAGPGGGVNMKRPQNTIDYSNQITGQWNVHWRWS